MPSEEVDFEITKQSADKQRAEAAEIMGQLEEFAYINASFVQSSNWDVRIALCERLPSDKTVPRFAVTMSHQHAKAFAYALTKNVERLEAAMGPIKWEPKEGSEMIAPKPPETKPS